MDMINLLTFINSRYGTSFELVGRFAGGLQGGAYELVDSKTSRRAVLKHSFAVYTPPVIKQLRAVGYPTPAWLAAGKAPGGVSYVVQEFASGRPMGRLSASYLEQIFALNELQANLNPSPCTHSWSHYAHNVVFANESGWAANIRAYSGATAELLTALEAVVQPHVHLTLPTSDVVHGDFCPDNMLVNDKQIVAVIDCAYAGYGTRIIDLATLLNFAYNGDYEDAVRNRLYDRIMQLAGPAVLAICLVYRTMAMIDWAIHRDTPETVMSYVRAAWHMLADLPS